MYRYRTLTPEQKTEVLRQRQLRGLPLHEPPHFHDAEGWFLITAATYEHKRYFQTEEDQAWLLGELLKELQVVKIAIGGWVVLPNHYHLLVARHRTALRYFQTEEDQAWLLGELLKELQVVKCQPLSVISQPLRRVHARTARTLNRWEGVSGRKVWHLFSDRQIRSERHYYTTLNYIHYNPTKHSCVQRPIDWACSSLHWYQKHFSIEWLRDLWTTYPVRDYGKGWDWFGSGSS